MRRSLVVLAVLASVCIAGCSQQQGGTPAAGAPVEATAVSPSVSEPSNADTASPTAGAVIEADVVEQQVLRPMQVESDDFWEEILELAGSSATVSAPMKFLNGDETFDCGGVVLSAKDNYGPAHCAIEDTIVVSEAFMARLGESEVLREDGTFVDPADDIAVYFLLAHEWGHNIIGELVAEKQADITLVPSSQIESVADCFAGLMIAGVPRVFSDKDPAHVLGYVQSTGERFAGLHTSPKVRQDALAIGMSKDYDDRQQFVAGVDECLRTQSPPLANALA